MNAVKKIRDQKPGESCRWTDDRIPDEWLLDLLDKCVPADDSTILLDIDIKVRRYEVIAAPERKATP